MAANPASSPPPPAQGILHIRFTWLILNFLIPTRQAAMPAAHGRERIANSQELSKERLSPNSGAIRVHVLALWLLSKQLGPHCTPLQHPPLRREGGTRP